MKYVNTRLVSIQYIDEVKVLTKSNNVYQYRISNLKSSTKYSFKSSEYRKHPLCNYETKATMPDDHPNSIAVMSRNIRKHEYRNGKSHLSSSYTTFCF